MYTYTFTAQCASGEWKTTTFQAAGYREARRMLNEFIRNN